MTKKRHPAQAAAAVTWRTEEWPLEKFLGTKKAGFNPKKADPEEIERLAEDYRTFGIGRSFAARDDGLLLDGHQSALAIQRLLKGEHLVPGVEGGEPVAAAWEPPKAVTMRVASGMSDAVARAFIAALVHNQVEPDAKLYGALLKDLVERVQGAAEGDRDYLRQALDAIGHGPDELADFIDQASFEGSEGGGSPPAKGSPKSTFDYSSDELKNAVKRAVAEHARKDEPAGDTLARMLGVRLPRKKPAPAPKKKKRA